MKQLTTKTKRIGQGPVVKKFFPHVELIKDATKPLLISVTQKDVSLSARSKHAECAMAKACERELKCDGVIISRSVAYVIRGNIATRYHVPASVSREVVAFDRGANFEPGEYQLSKPSHYLGHPSGKKTQTGTGEKRFRHVTKNVRVSLLEM